MIKTVRQYDAYRERVRKFHESEGIDLLCDDITNLNGEPSEPYFSWKPCHCCGSQLGGDRYDMVGVSLGEGVGERKGEYAICTDCYYYNTYDRLDDETMLRIEESMSDH